MKIISRILATISFLGIAWYFSPSFWYWTGFEFIAAILVVTGCAGEWYLHMHPAGRKKREKDEHHKTEGRFIALVVVGVFMELFALGHTIKEGVTLEKDVAIARSNNLVLQSNLVWFKSAAMPRSTRLRAAINDSVVDEFRKFKGIKVSITAHSDDPDGIDFGDALGLIFSKSGWEPPKTEHRVWGVGPQGIQISAGETALPAAKALETFLRKCSIGSMVLQGGHTNEMGIFVGSHFVGYSSGMF
jgi:hypothetical protein